MADVNAQFDHQVIKVFSICSRNQAAYDFWIKVSRYLMRYGPEYRNRCNSRKTRGDGGSATKAPDVFDHQKYSTTFTDERYTFEGEADLNELHETLAVEKFTPVTKSLYNSILADMEIVLPIALNPDERRIVKHQGTSVVIGRSGTGKTTALVYKMRANTQSTIMEERPLRQLFVTRSRVLTQHIAHNYRGLIDSNEIANKTREELAEIRKRNEQERKRELVEYDNEVDLRDDLPDRFSELQDHHFPLFVSFDKLCSLLEADIKAKEGRRFQTYPLLNFNDFKYTYWPKLNHVLTRNLDPGLVFSEILGVIKGCGQDLTEDSYLNSLSHKRSPLLMNVRDRVYAIFEAYSKQCRVRNQIDNADRTRAILAAHERHPFPQASQVDYVFVDEVQDQLMLDIHLLQSLCKNPDGGYWCGDTAQTISVGSSFRIKDLKAFIYDDMISYQKSNHQRKAPAPFATFELCTNFRSHSGIVKYAASLVELIYTMFPDSIDHMAPESANTPGRPPLLFISPTNDHNIFLQHLLSKDIPFGAHQGIIVRSQATADWLNKYLEKRCTVLTLLDTKGLEFDDVVLYNFFSESEAPAATWAPVLALGSKEKEGRIVYDKDTVPPWTSPVLCAELKQLYVAVTRARYRCWIWDSGDVIDLMKNFWSNPGLITMSESLENMGSFAVSTKDLREWARRGQELFSNGLYVQAKSCFEQAGQSDEVEIADAYIHMTDARRSQDRQKFLQAAAKMEKCASRPDSGRSGNVLWYHAATCYESAQDIASASRAYRNGGFYDRAALVAFDHQLFDEVLLTILPHSHAIEQSAFEKIRDVCRMHYLRNSNYEKLRKLFNNDQSACIEYASSSGFSVQHKELLKQGGRTEDLANVFLEEGSPADAVECLLKSTARSSVIKRVKSITSDYLWLNLAMDSTPDQNVCDQASKLFELLAQLEGSDPRGLMDLDLKMFKASLGQGTLDLRLLDRDDLGTPEQKHRLLLGYHHALRANSWVDDSDLDETSIFKHLEAWTVYAREIYSIAKEPKPSQSSFVQRLLGCSAPSKKLRNTALVNVAASSFLYQCAKDRRVRIDKRASKGDNLLSGADADRLIKHELVERMDSRLMDLHSSLLDLRLISVSATTSRPISVPDPFEVQMRIIYMATSILNPIRTRVASGLPDTVYNTIQIAWVSRAYSLLHPISGMINGFSTESGIKDDQVSVKCLYEWASSSVQSLNPLGDNPHLFLSTFIMGISLKYDLGRRHGYRFSWPPLPKYQQSVICHGCSSGPFSVTNGVLELVSREGQSRVTRGILLLRHIVDNELSIGLPVLVSLFEVVTREAILAERMATSPQLLGGISGLIMPASWTKDLMSYSRQLTREMFGMGPIHEFALCISNAMHLIQETVPTYWNPFSVKYSTSDTLLFSVRMCCCIALIVVNINSDHAALPVTLDILQQCTQEVFEKFQSKGLVNEDEDSSPLRLMVAMRDRQTCLSALKKIMRHEELILLNRRGDLQSEVSKQFISNVVAFHDWRSLRHGVLGYSGSADVTSEQSSSQEGQNQDVDPPQHDNLPIPEDPSAPDCSPSEESGQKAVLPTDAQTASHSAEVESTSSTFEPDKPEMIERQADAAQRIQSCWRHYKKRQKLAGFSNRLGAEGEYYERLRPMIFQRVPGKSARAKLFRKIFCGPGLLVLLSLDMLSDQLEDSLEELREAYKDPEIDGKAIEVLQERQKVIERYYSSTDKLRKELSPDSPEGVFKIINLAGIKMRTRQYMKGAFTDITESDELRDNEIIGEAKELFLRGVGPIQKS
ncbi:UvrD-helicase domain protein [Ceratobasidium sp. AG-Ba]|nr:UvrD-helicase domain protein [Ceratobasidium sp. AG-Ba]